MNVVITIGDNDNSDCFSVIFNKSEIIIMQAAVQKLIIGIPISETEKSLINQFLLSTKKIAPFLL